MEKHKWLVIKIIFSVAGVCYGQSVVLGVEEALVCFVTF